MSNKTLQLQGRVFVTFNILAATGLHIGGSDSGIEIGGVDKTVIRDPLTNRPYIPGSSLKGKMRSLLEKYNGLEQNQRIGQGYIHSCQEDGTYAACNVCQVFGVPGERDFGSPTRLIVRDVHMGDAEAKRIADMARTDLPFTEVKTEVSIDRVTSAANPRQMERVPAGTSFGPAEFVYSIYDGDDCDARKDVERLQSLAEGLQLLADDYLGGLGSRGSGKINFQKIRVTLRPQGAYLEAPVELGQFDDLVDFVQGLGDIQHQVRMRLDLE
ncbi:MAG: type III-A CRISPR-associated RAMP protein Csm3 [Caldilineales bacterium]|nr:type III-A CRISPR-associated RAMP protein Csm3 [Caldilineales bacterium]